jgi:hypothetical protein
MSARLHPLLHWRAAPGADPAGTPPLTPQANAAADYIMTAQQFLTMSLTQLAEIPQRVNFSKQRVSQVPRPALPCRRPPAPLCPTPPGLPSRRRCRQPAACAPPAG